MKKLNLLLILLSFISCEKKANTDHITFHTKTVINIDKLQCDSVGFADNYDKLQKLDIQEISLDEFNKLNISKDSFVKIPIKKKLLLPRNQRENNTIERRKRNNRNKKKLV